MKRDERKFLKDPDEFIVWTTRGATWMQQHRSLVAGVLGAVTLGAVGAGLVAWRSLRQTDAASEAFRVARTKFTSGDFPECATAFADLAGEYPSTSFGRLAVLYRGHCLLRQGDAANAAVAYREFLARSPDDAYVRQLALTALAHAQEQSGSPSEARATLADAGTVPGPYRIDALLGYARLSEAAGDTAAAQGAYRKVLDENPDPETKTFIQRQLPAEGEKPTG